MKSESKGARKVAKRTPWIIDEQKYLSTNELGCIMSVVANLKRSGIHYHRFTLVRRWFMIVLALNTGLRASEMASLRHGNLFIDQDRS